MYSIGSVSRVNACCSVCMTGVLALSSLLSAQSGPNLNPVHATHANFRRSAEICCACIPAVDTESRTTSSTRTSKPQSSSLRSHKRRSVSRCVQSVLHVQDLFPLHVRALRVPERFLPAYCAWLPPAPMFVVTARARAAPSARPASFPSLLTSIEVQTD